MHRLQRFFAPQNRPFIIYVALLGCLFVGAQLYKGHLTPRTLAQVKGSVGLAVTDKNELSKLKMQRSTLEFQLPNLRLKYPLLTNAALAAQWQQATLLSQLDPQVCTAWRAYLDQVSPALQQRTPALAPFLTLQQGYELEVERLARDPFLKDKPARLLLLRTNKFATLFTQPTYVADAAQFQALARTLDDETTLVLHRAYQQALTDSATNLNPALASYGAAYLEHELKADLLRGQIAQLNAQLGETNAASAVFEPTGAFPFRDLLSRGKFETYVPERRDFISLEAAMLIIGLLLTSPLELRDRRWLKIGASLVLVFLCLLALRIPVGLSLAERGTNVFAFFGFLVPAALLAAVWASDFTFFFSRVFVQLLDPAGPQETEDTRLTPAYEAARQGQYRKALKLLKPKLLVEPWNYETLVLKAKLHRQLGRPLRARLALKKLLRNPRLDPTQREHAQHLLQHLKHPTEPCWSFVQHAAPRQEFEELSTW